MCRLYIISNDFCLAILINEITNDGATHKERRGDGEASERQRRGNESETVIGRYHQMHEQRIEWRVH